MSEKECENEVEPGYSRSPELMNRADTLLWVVDLQQLLVPVVENAHLVTWNCERLARGAKMLGVASVATEQYPEKLGPTLAGIAEHLSSPPESKLAFSAAVCESLFRTALDAGKQRVLLCGIETHVCVAQSAYDLMAMGFRVYLAADAVGTRHRVDHDTALRRLESAGVTITSTEAALFEWCEQAGTPEFKQISQLVKQPAPNQEA